MKHVENAKMLSQGNLRSIFKNEQMAVDWMESVMWGKTELSAVSMVHFGKVKPCASKKDGKEMLLRRLLFYLQCQDEFPNFALT